MRANARETTTMMRDDAKVSREEREQVRRKGRGKRGEGRLEGESGQGKESGRIRPRERERERENRRVEDRRGRMGEEREKGNVIKQEE